VIYAALNPNLDAAPLERLAKSRCAALEEMAGIIRDGVRKMPAEQAIEYLNAVLPICLSMMFW
jgi:hypothetical protein